MRWQDREQSSNVEDRRRAKPATIAAGGGLGLIVVLGIMLLMGADPQTLLNVLQQSNPASTSDVGSVPPA